MTLGEFYRANGESKHVARLEAALTGEWASTAAIAAVADVSEKWARRALEYLAEEGRAEGRLVAPPGRRRRRWEWRRPA